MFYSLKDKIRRIRFAGQCKAVLHSAPVALKASSNLALLSQLQHKDVLMFLLAVKSFVKQVEPGAVIVLNDGSLTHEDTKLLGKHIPGVIIRDLPPFRSPACPNGGCWERLLAISSFIEDYYVIQLDSDTLTVGSIDEVLNCVRHQKAFALATWDNQNFETMRERWERASNLKPGPDSHVQLVAEANFDKLRDFDALHYVRGCAGFAGFARKSFTRDFIDTISTQMRAAIGDKWAQWGSEQVMSNIVVANIPNAVVLPHPKYADCQKMRVGETAFIHFIGSCRFNDGTYARLGAQVIEAL